jgi:predicted membrane channel-forming protein YqfA (hemolysin III family)
MNGDRRMGRLGAVIFMYAWAALTVALWPETPVLAAASTLLFTLAAFSCVMLVTRNRT